MIKKDYSQSIQILPKIGDIIESNVLEIGKNEIYLDMNGEATGIIRGPELIDMSGKLSNLRKGDKIMAMVIDEENEKGLVEFSLKRFSEKKIWKELSEIIKKGDKISVKIISANRGGLIIQYGKIQGFLPASQLSPKNYPHTEGGDKNKILEKLQHFVNKKLKVRIINADERNKKLIVSEKDNLSREKTPINRKHKVGDIIEGKITGLVDFGVFVTFDKDYEGLIHISELAWQRLDHPRDIVKVNDKIKAKIIKIADNNQISLSAKKLITDPWKKINENYKIEQIVKGKILKVNPFGLFVELSPNIHGLAHISELSDKPIKDISKFAKPGDELKFKIVSIETENHRLGLSIKALKK